MTLGIEVFLENFLLWEIFALNEVNSSNVSRVVSGSTQKYSGIKSVYLLKVLVWLTKSHNLMKLL